MKQYIVKSFHPESSKYDSIRRLFNDKGWSCFPFVVTYKEDDPLGYPICIIPDAPHCGSASLSFFEYEQV